MDDEKLIEAVRQYEELYNMVHRKYSDNNHKDKIWSKIGQELNETGQACKIRWISLRDQLRKAIKKKVPKSGDPAVKTKKWKYEDCMSFLIPYFKERETQSNIAEPEPEDSDREKNDESYIENNDREMTEIATVFSNKKKTTNATQSPKVASPHSFLKSRKTRQPETASTILMKYLVESEKNDSKKSANTFSPSSTHPIDLFLSGIAATVKSLSPELQHMAKSRIFTLVAELEWIHLQNQKRNAQISSPDAHSIPSHDSTKAFQIHHMQRNQQYDTPQLPSIGSASTSTLHDSLLYVQTPTPSPVKNSGRSSTQEFYEGFSSQFNS